MTRTRTLRVAVATVLLISLTGAATLVINHLRQSGRTHVVAYFENSNGIFVGDDVRVRGVNIGKISAIEPEPTRVKISFWFNDDYQVPADVNAVVLSPTLVTARAIQLTPPYRNGATLQDHTVIPEDRTAVPVEFDDFRDQLEKLTQTLQPTQPGGVSTLGEFVSTAAANLRGQGPSIRDAIIKLSQAVSALSDHSGDTFASVKNVATLVSALQDSTALIRQLNTNLASVTGLLANDPDEVSHAVADLNAVVGDVSSFVSENRETLGTTSDKLASVSQALHDSLGDIKQVLHVLPTTLANANNLYQPAQGTLSGIAAINNFADPITFLCGGLQAASRLGAEQSAKLCVQYLAPIIKNRQYNFPPLGFNPFVGTSARPNELTYSEDWMRPDYVPPRPPAPAETLTPAADPAAPAANVALPAEAQPGAPTPPPTQPTDPASGLTGLMVPAEAGAP